MSTLKELTPEEMSKPYAKYYTMEPAPADPGMMAAMETPMDPSKALPIENLNDVLNLRAILPRIYEEQKGKID